MKQHVASEGLPLLLYTLDQTNPTQYKTVYCCIELHLKLI